eukprot:TRINITY_DN11_c0_g2_i1.p1 TRINITY_DN11_c0_g2~~TRINITY_DN11_c0_g2_i1.p1  ORF type:complete len:309 (+),score=72.68 TRINITY_DN11_c0_g2_i1:68-994(+)
MNNIGMKNHAPVSKEEASCNLIVNYLPANYDERQFKELFQQFGTIDKIKLLTDPQTGASKCYGFVKFARPEEADRAIRDMSGFEVQGKKLRVAYAQSALMQTGPSPSINVFFSGFGSYLTEQQIKEMASEFGEVQDVSVLDVNKHQRGVGFVRFTNVSQAENCVNTLNGREFTAPHNGTFTLAVKYAERKQRNTHSGRQQQQQLHQAMLQFPFNMMQGGKGFGGMPTGGSNTVFVHGIAGANENVVLQAVYAIFGAIGRILKVDVPKHITGEPRNFCFIHFSDFAAAQAALTFNGHVIENRQLQVRFK